jgi:hypothetical protein
MLEAGIEPSNIKPYICASESQDTSVMEIKCKRTDCPEWPTTKLDFAASSLPLVVAKQGIGLRIDTRVS